MGFTRPRLSRTLLATLALAGGLVAAATPAAAQDDARLRKLEAQVRALQRQVFPGGDGKFFPPEVVTPGAGTPAPAAPVGTPAQTVTTDMLNRLDSIEAQLARLTARTEVTDNALSQLQARVDALEAKGVAVPAPTGAEGDGAAPVQPTGAIPVPDEPKPAAAPDKTARGTGTKSSSRTASAAAPSADRVAAVEAIVKPDTGNPGDDAYSYGFRLWDAGFFPEAEQQLKLYVDKYPKDPKISYGRNLLGRAYLDDKQPRAAAPYFLENYQKDPNGARAPDSLLFLAESMLALNDSTRACRALAEFADKYPAVAGGRLQSQYDKDRKQAACK